MKVYEDALCYVELAKKPVTEGHLQVYPKKEVKSLEEMDDELVQHLFFVASYCATGLFEGLKAQGTNIIINNGKNAGQKEDNICVDVIARFEKDELPILWEPKQGDQAKLEETFKQVKGEAFYVNKSPDKKQNKEEKPPEKIDGDNYMIEHLNKLP